MKVLVCGSRNFGDALAGWDVITARLVKLTGRDPLVITGGARGADAIAHTVAKFCGFRTQTFRADWKTHGRRAGILRNLAMLDEQPDLVIAFWDGKSRGTKHTVDEAVRRGIPVEILAAAVSSRGSQR